LTQQLEFLAVDLTITTARCVKVRRDSQPFCGVARANAASGNDFDGNSSSSRCLALRNRDAALQHFDARGQRRN
jgi:hypothetical protein